jgi:hypothetical protein
LDDSSTPDWRELYDKLTVEIEISPEIAKLVEKYSMEAVAVADEGQISEIQSEFAAMSEIRKLVGKAVPLTPRENEEYELIRRFCTDPQGLGLTDTQFEHGSMREIATRLRLWVGKHLNVKGAAGRPQSPETERIFNRWLALGKPSLSKQNLSKDIFGTSFTTASPVDKKKMIDLCRSAVTRFNQRQLSRKNVVPT